MTLGIKETEKKFRKNVEDILDPRKKKHLPKSMTGNFKI